MTVRKTFAFLALCIPLALSASTSAATPDGPLAEKAQITIDKGLVFLKTQQKPDGSWENNGDPPAITALALKAFVSDSRHTAQEPFLTRGFTRLLSYQKPDGGIFNDVLANYNTAIAITALAASKDPEYQPQLEKALAFLRRLQWTDKIDNVPDRQNVPDTDPRYGGFGYGKRARPDGSNMQIALDALHDAGVKPDDPAFAAAVAFASHLQNRSESNNQAWAGDDGGFIYTDANGGASMAGEMTGPKGRKIFRSYGSMTYAGLKSMIYAGLSKDDPRVRSAWEWISKNWTMDENPGIRSGEASSPEFGLFYYYYTAARALRAYGEPIVIDAQGIKHDWRREMIDKLSSLQHSDGSWTGQAKWMENNATLATSFAVLALEEAVASSNPEDRAHLLPQQ